MNNSPHIYIDNSGFNNKGDHLMIEASIQAIRKRIPNAIILLKPSAFYQNPSYCFQNHILPLQAPTNLIRRCRIRLATDYLLNRHWYITPSQIDLVLDARGFQFGDPFSYRADKKGIALSKQYYESFTKKNRKIIFLPQAYGPFNNSGTSELIRQTYQFATHMFARDRISYQYLTEIIGSGRNNISIAPDFTAFIDLPKTSSINLPPGENIIIIANSKMVSDTCAEVSSQYINFLQKTISFLQNECGESIILLNHEGTEDEKLLQGINHLLSKQAPIISNLGGIDIKSIIGRAKLVISSRYHGVINGLSQGIPTLCTSWSHKYEELLHEHGCPYNILDVTNIDEAQRIIKDAILHPEKYSSKTNNLKQIKGAIEKMWDMVLEG